MKRSRRLRPRSPRPAGAYDLVHRTTWRLGIQAAALVLGCLVLVAGLLLAKVADSQQHQVQTTLAQAVLGVHQPLGHTGDGPDRPDADHDADNSAQLAVRDPSGLWIQSGMPAGLPDQAAMDAVQRTGTARRSDVELHGRSYATWTVKNGDDVVQAVLDLQPEHREWTRLISAVAVAGGVGLVAVAAAAIYLARRAVRPLARALAVQRRFVADAGHELRTPLTLLSTRAQLLQRRLAGERIHDPVQVARATADLQGLVTDARHLTELLEDLLIAADTTQERPLVQIDLVPVAVQVVEAARASAETRAVRLTLDAGVAATVLGNRPALDRVLTALIDNAVGHARSRVDVAVRTVNDQVEVAVDDDGPGVPPDQMETLFDRFHTTRPATADSGSRHYGLGLALVSDVMAQLGGSVSVEPRPGGDPGARFLLRLPALRSRPTGGPVGAGDTRPR